MTQRQARELPPGLYLIYWYGGQTSLAAIGRMSNGDRWLAPTTWELPTTSQAVWEQVEAAAKIKAYSTTATFSDGGDQTDHN